MSWLPPNGAVLERPPGLCSAENLTINVFSLLDFCLNLRGWCRTPAYSFWGAVSGVSLWRGEENRSCHLKCAAIKMKLLQHLYLLILQLHLCWMSVLCRILWNTKGNVWIQATPLGLEIHANPETSVHGLQLQNYRSESLIELSKVFKALSVCWFQWSLLLIVSLESKCKWLKIRMKWHHLFPVAKRWMEDRCKLNGYFKVFFFPMIGKG